MNANDEEFIDPNLPEPNAGRTQPADGKKPPQGKGAARGQAGRQKPKPPTGSFGEDHGDLSIGTGSQQSVD